MFYRIPINIINVMIDINLCEVGSNPLFVLDNTRMLFSDANVKLQEVLKELQS
jgi:NAD/NADP transhydrogenase beta subunit